MWQLLKTEFEYQYARFAAYGLVIVGFAFFMPDLPGGEPFFLKEIPIYVTFAMAFSLLSKARKENRGRCKLLLPVSLKKLAVARILLVMPFVLGMTVLALTSPGHILEDIGQQILFLNVVLLALIHQDLRGYPFKGYRIGYYSIATAYFSLLIAFYELASLAVFFWGILFVPFLILSFVNYVLFTRRESYLV